MGQIDEYLKHRNEFLEEEKTKGLSVEDEFSGDFDYTTVEMKEEYRKKRKGGEYYDRIKYYFEDEGVMEAKAERYRNLADNSNDLNTYAARYTNHSANKRKKSARKAADAFEQAAALEEAYKDEKTDSMTKLAHTEEIMRLRLEGMERAAEVKSRSEANESFRKFKAKISCLTVLKERAQILIKDEREREQKDALTIELRRIEQELTAAEGEMTKLVPPVQKQWSEAIGIPADMKKKLADLKKKNPDIDEKTAANIIRIKELSKEAYRPEMNDALRGIAEHNLYPDHEVNEGDKLRFMSFSLYTVLRDKNGMPINKSELKKAKHNKRWLDALRDGNVEEKKAVILESFRHYEKLTLPSPRELKERGVMWFLQNKPADFMDIQRMTTCMNNLNDIDSDAKEYYDSHPELQKKHSAAAQLCQLFQIELARSGLVKTGSADNDGTGYEVEKTRLAEIDIVHSKEEADNYYNEYKREYDNAYEGGVRREVLELLNEREQSSIKLFEEKYPDEYDKEMRRKLNSTMDTDLGRELWEKKNPQEMTELAERVYQNVIGGETLSNTRLMKRVEDAAEKKHLQMAMRNRMEIFLNKRQMQMGKALCKDFYLLSDRRGLVELNTKKAVENQTLDTQYLDYARDWCSIKDKSLSLAAKLNPETVKLQMASDVRAAGKELLSLDISIFAYKSDEEFVSKLHNNYIWLQKAKSLKDAYDKLKEQGEMENTKNFSMSVLEGRLLAFEEMKADYDARIAMMNSPYYALLSKEDLSAMSDEELEEKQNAARQSDPALYEFLKNYRFLNTEKEGFSMGKDPVSCEERAGEVPRQKAADWQNAEYDKIVALGLMPGDGEDMEAYKKRLVKALMDDARANVPKVDTQFMRTKVPPLLSSNKFGGLLGDDAKNLVVWIEDNLSDTKALKEKGVSDWEIERLKNLQKESYEARYMMEMAAYAQDKHIKWNSGAMELPENNKNLNVEKYEKLKTVFDAYQTIAFSLGKKQGSETATAEDAYCLTVLSMTQIFTSHNIIYSKDSQALIDKNADKERAALEKEAADGKDAVIKIGGKEYHLPGRLKDFFTGLEDKTIDEKYREQVDKLVDEIRELYIRSKACDNIQILPPSGVYSQEFVDISKINMIAIKDNILMLKNIGLPKKEQWENYITGRDDFKLFFMQAKQKNKFITEENAKYIYMNKVVNESLTANKVKRGAMPPIFKDAGMACDVERYGLAKKVGVAGSASRSIGTAMYVVRRDLKGNCIDEEEKRKEEHNEKWLNAYKEFYDGKAGIMDAQEKNKGVDEAKAVYEEKRQNLFKLFLSFTEDLLNKYTIPTPEELGADPYYMEKLLYKDPDLYFIIYRFSGDWDEFGKDGMADLLEEEAKKNPKLYLFVMLTSKLKSADSVTTNVKHHMKADLSVNVKDATVQLHKILDDKKATEEKKQEAQQEYDDEMAANLESYNDFVKQYENNYRLMSETDEVKTDRERFAFYRRLQSLDDDNLNDIMDEQKGKGIEITLKTAEVYKIMVLSKQYGKNRNLDDFKRKLKKKYPEKADEIFNKSINPFLKIVSYMISRQSDPATGVDQKMAEWNEKWFACFLEDGKEEEKKQLMEESVRDLLFIDIPSQQELEKDGLKYHIQKDAFTWGAIITKIKQLSDFEASEPELYNSIMNSDPALKERLAYMQKLSADAESVLEKEFHIKPTADSYEFTK